MSSSEAMSGFASRDERKPMSDVELADRLGISLTELKHWRADHKRRVVDKASEVFERMLRASLTEGE